MPLYEYKCLNCGKHFDFIQKFDDPPKEVCPECGGRLKKVLSAPAFKFNGSGWYVTDYSRKQSGMNTNKEAKNGTNEKKEEVALKEDK